MVFLTYRMSFQNHSKGSWEICERQELTGPESCYWIEYLWRLIHTVLSGLGCKKEYGEVDILGAFGDTMFLSRKTRNFDSVLKRAQSKIMELIHPELQVGVQPSGIGSFLIRIGVLVRYWPNFRTRKSYVQTVLGS